MDAVDGVADILPGRDQEAEGEAGHDGDGVVKPTHRAQYFARKFIYYTIQARKVYILSSLQFLKNF